jgi:hypothetical protein
LLAGLPALQLDLGLGIAETDRPVDPDRRTGLVRDDDLRLRGQVRSLSSMRSCAATFGRGGLAGVRMTG